MLDKRLVNGEAFRATKKQKSYALAFLHRRKLLNSMFQIFFGFDRTVIVAVVTVRVMKSAIDYVVGMVSVGNSLVSAARAMDMAICMLDRLALIWIRFINLQTMLIVVVTVFVMHMTVMQVVDVISMLDLGVTTVLAVHMGMILMYFTFCVSHHLLPHFVALRFQYRPPIWVLSGIVRTSVETMVTI